MDHLTLCNSSLLIPSFEELSRPETVSSGLRLHGGLTPLVNPYNIPPRGGNRNSCELFTLVTLSLSPSYSLLPAGLTFLSELITLRVAFYLSLKAQYNSLAGLRSYICLVFRAPVAS